MSGADARADGQTAQWLGAIVVILVIAAGKSA